MQASSKHFGPVGQGHVRFFVCVDLQSQTLQSLGFTHCLEGVGGVMWANLQLSPFLQAPLWK